MKKKSLRIVIADNESIIRMDLREMLEDAGHEVVGEAADGWHAVEVTRSRRPDLVIMDIKMPEMDDIVDRAKDSGVLGYLVKPVEESNLFPAMEIALSRWEEMQSLSAELDKVKDTLEMRKTLDRAKGILMAVHHLTEKEAYRRIQQYAMTKRMTVKDVAEAIVRAAVK